MGTPLGSIPKIDPKGTVWEYSGERMSIFSLFLTKSYRVLYKDK